MTEIGGESAAVEAGPSRFADACGEWSSEPRRLLLRDELAKASTDALASMYWEAVRALDNAGDAEKYAIAGYLLRELQDHLPKHIDVPRPKPQGRLGDFFQWLADYWDRLNAKTGCRDTDGIWVGSIDVPLAGFLADLGDRVEMHRLERPRWRNVQAMILTHLDPELAGAPEATQSVVVDAWLELHNEFNTAAHHGHVDGPTFEAKILDFEELLGDRLVPRTFEKQSQIDALVAEAEGRADD